MNMMVNVLVPARIAHFLQRRSSELINPLFQSCQADVEVLWLGFPLIRHGSPPSRFRLDHGTSSAPSLRPLSPDPSLR